MYGVVQLAVFLYLIRDCKWKLTRRCKVNKRFIVCGGTQGRSYKRVLHNYLFHCIWYGGAT